MKNNNFLQSILTCLFFVCSFMSGFGQTAKYSNEFMNLGVGARQLAMGNATVATANDVYAGYWNPAGLTNIESNIQFAGMYNNYFAGLASYNYLALSAKVSDSSNIAFSYLRFGIDNIPNTLALIDESGNIRYDQVSSFSAIDNAILISYARKSKIPNLKLGASVKIILRSAGEFASAYGFGIDLSAQYKLNNWQFAAVLRDATSTYNSWTFSTENLADVFALTGNDIPVSSTEITNPRLILGAARLFPLSEKLSVQPECDIDITTDGKRNTVIKTNLISIDPKLGFELGYNEKIFLRAGINKMQAVNDINGESTFNFQPNIGLGVVLNKLSVDYALTDMGNGSIALYSNVFSLRLAIDRERE